MEELIELLKSAGVDEEVASNAVAIATSAVEAETEKGKGYYRKKDGELLKHKQESEKLISELKEQLSAREKADGEKETTLESLQNEINAMKQEKEQALASARKTSVENSLLQTLGSDFVGDKATIAGLLAINEYSQDGDITLNGQTVGDFVASYRESNPRMFSVQQKEGGGELPPKTEPKSINDMTLEDLGL